MEQVEPVTFDTLPPSSSRRLGDYLMESGALDEATLTQALQRQAIERAASTSTGRSNAESQLGKIIVELGGASRSEVTRALSRQRGIAEVDVSEVAPTPEAIKLLPAETVTKYHVLPLSMDTDSDAGGRLVLAMADPLDREVRKAIRAMTGCALSPRWADESALRDAIGRHYGSQAERMISDLAGDSGRTSMDTKAQGDLAAHLQELAAEPTVVNLVNLLILEAIQARASDVHVEPFEHMLRVKYRIDGLLHEIKPPPKHLQDAIASRLKIMAGMNIAERFVPQDGHIDFPTPTGKVDLRVATAPTVYGESIVLRILDAKAALYSLDTLGLDDERLNRVKTTLGTPHGIFLVTGPTGSGKTTTLYAALQHIFTPALKIITIEDPVEYRLDGVNQMPVNRKRGLTFADGLRAILRQDPDVVMIGEIRDRETADIAIRAALTGHLVFSTLHTNDAAGAVTRLTDMGVEPFLIASSLRGVLAQRLVRRVCAECRREMTPSAALMRRMGHRAGEVGTWYEGAGCRACRHVGYRGRMGVFELITIEPAVREAINRRADAVQIREALGASHVTMAEDGYRKAAAGETTLEEVLRVTHE
ncbi:MAG: GspE/PulE family protein [Planctomycetota bacterium]